MPGETQRTTDIQPGDIPAVISNPWVSRGLALLNYATRIPTTVKEMQAATLAMKYDPKQDAVAEVQEVLLPRAWMQAARAVEEKPEFGFDLFTNQERMAMDAIQMAHVRQQAILQRRVSIPNVRFLTRTRLEEIYAEADRGTTDPHETVDRELKATQQGSLAMIAKIDDARNGSGMVPYGVRVDSDKMHTFRDRLERNSDGTPGGLLDSKPADGGLTRREEIKADYIEQFVALATESPELNIDPSLPIQRELDAMLSDYEADYSARRWANFWEVIHAGKETVVKTGVLLVGPFGLSQVANFAAGELGVAIDTANWLNLDSPNLPTKLLAGLAVLVAFGGITEALAKGVADTVQGIQLQRKINALRREGKVQMEQIRQEFREMGFTIPEPTRRNKKDNLSLL